MEFVFVIPRTALFPECAPHGLALFGDGGGAVAWSSDRFERCVERDGFFVERDHAERTPELKQVIPYTLVVRGQDVLLLQRTKGGGEARLHDKLSIGVGGHVNPVDAIETEPNGATLRRSNPQRRSNPLAAATRREVMDEELVVEGATRLRQVGLLNDDTNAVGAVHVGLVQVLELLEGDARVREVDCLRGAFVPLFELVERAEAGANFETWSSLLIPHLDRILQSSAERNVASAPPRETSSTTAPS
ncbi:MAG: hypothetical protein AAGA20_10300 [Planctomycetota bacterium]